RAVVLRTAIHHPRSSAPRFKWLMAATVLPIGPVIRHFFNCRHEGKGSPWWTWVVAAAGRLAVAWLSGAGPRGAATPARAEKAAVKAAHNTILARCSMCHRDEPVWPGIYGPPKGVVLDSPDNIARHAHLIEVNAVRSN